MNKAFYYNSVSWYGQQNVEQIRAIYYDLGKTDYHHTLVTQRCIDVSRSCV